MDVSFGNLYGLALGFNYLNFEANDEGQFEHVVQILLLFFLVEISWTQ